ncbi:MAG: glutathione S-transferase family protein [Methyloceanibacter sp.]|nr:glutathione S-transferase family protein [Methyloceanibacter sp.]
MSDLTLYHAVPSRSSIVRWMLEEIGAPYEIELLVLTKGEHLTVEFKAINPMAKVPALRHGEAVVTEAAAICTYLADEFPDAGLNVPIGDPVRGAYLKWLFFGPSCIEPAMMDAAYPRKEEPHRGTLGYGGLERVMEVVAQGVATGPYLLGERFTAADVVVGSTLRFGIVFKLLPEVPEVMDYIERLQARPAMQRTLALDEELAAAQS